MNVKMINSLVLRSDDLLTPHYRLEGFGKSCFAHGSPSLWNTLPTLSSVPSPLTLSRVVWRHVCFMSHIHNSTWQFYHIMCIFPASVWWLSDNHKRFWAWLVAVEISAIENWHFCYPDYHYHYYIHAILVREWCMHIPAIEMSVLSVLEFT